MLKTILCDILEVEYPIILGGMAYAGTHGLAAAVSNAGGFGVIGSGNLEIDALREEIHRCRGLTSRPFGVNCFLKDPECLAKARVSIQEGVHALFTGIGNPAPVLEIARGSGIPVVPTVATVRHALSAIRAGAPLIVAEGQEGGGHIGAIGTLPLLAQVRGAVEGRVPIIAAGGIGDGSQMAACLMMGAVGVMMGTRFLSAEESPLHRLTKEWLIGATIDDTTVTGSFTGLAMRCLANDFTSTFQTMERTMSPIDMLRFGSGKIRAGLMEGDVATGSCPCGQVVGQIRGNETAGEIIAAMVKEAGTLLQRIIAAGGFDGWKGAPE
ncbi:MAG: nitronate monooxygenase [Spirochaetes bacterium]|nr:nitronate monooxygenase [Spirochaetota bacterium]